MTAKEIFEETNDLIRFLDGSLKKLDRIVIKKELETNPKKSEKYLATGSALTCMAMDSMMQSRIRSTLSPHGGEG
ncbi:MAG TPA: hypothetical protein VFX30_01300 [bacterium]|nr:hypothetical protein [bacterium]